MSPLKAVGYIVGRPTGIAFMEKWTCPTNMFSFGDTTSAETESRIKRC
jgi:hypothetical protein